MRYEEPPFLGQHYTKRYVSFLTSNNVSDVFNEHLKLIVEKNAEIFLVSHIEIILKYELYSGIIESPQEELPSIADIYSTVKYDNYDEFVSKTQEILAKRLDKFLTQYKLEFCSLKLVSACMGVCYSLHPVKTIPLF